MIDIFNPIQGNQ